MLPMKICCSENIILHLDGISLAFYIKMTYFHAKTPSITFIIMAQTSMTVRMDNNQKAIFDSLCEQFGMSANTAINIFVRTVIRTKSIPFPIQVEDDARAQAQAAFKRICDTARENNVEMTLDEINDEMRESRRERK